MSGSEIWAPSAEQISPSMIDRLLDERDLLRLDRILLAKNAPAPSVRRRNARRTNGDKLGGICGRFVQSCTWQEINDLYDLTGAARNL